ncbi:MAG: hypothetical protein V4812_17055 [Pseudomonadota bacterium]
MIEALIHFVLEVLLYGKGYGALRLLSFGRIRPGRWNDGLVQLVGLAVTLAWVLPLLIWLTGQGEVVPS